MALLLLAGCSSAPPREARTFAAPLPLVLAAARDALHDQKDVEVDGARIETSWGPERDAGREQGFLFGNAYRVRVRYRIECEPAGGGTLVRANATVERRAPGGVRSLRWERVPSDGRFERGLLDALDARLAGMRTP
ncbi:MAG: hypothetical protein HYY17_04590 [Planctomycetes bacterium]|nr:hypothetical protein [Planctomycetota bacterium]